MIMGEFLNEFGRIRVIIAKKLGEIYHIYHYICSVNVSYQYSYEKGDVAPSSVWTDFNLPSLCSTYIHYNRWSGCEGGLW